MSDGSGFDSLLQDILDRAAGQPRADAGKEVDQPNSDSKQGMERNLTEEGREVAADSGVAPASAPADSVPVVPAAPRIRRQCGPCTRCGHSWLAYGDYRPLNCSACHSAYWDKPRKLGIGPVRPRDSTKEIRWRKFRRNANYLSRLWKWWGEATTLELIDRSLTPTLRRRLNDMFQLYGIEGKPQEERSPIRVALEPEIEPAPLPADLGREFLIPPPPGYDDRGRR